MGRKKAANPAADEQTQDTGDEQTQDTGDEQTSDPVKLHFSKAYCGSLGVFQRDREYTLPGDKAALFLKSGDAVEVE